MKILLLAPYLFVDNHPYGSRNRSGLAYMIRAVADMLTAEGNEVKVLTQAILTEEMNVNGWTLAKRSPGTILKGLRFRYFREYLRLLGTDFSGAMMLRNLFYFASGGQAETLIKTFKPDVIHIHGIGTYVLPYYIAASRYDIPVVTTLHGLVSFNSVTGNNRFTCCLERELIKEFVANGYTMSFIGSGMIERAKSLVGGETPNIHLISNTFQLKCAPNAPEKDPSVKRIICVGGISDLKNHIQVVRLMPQIQAHFAGRCDVSLEVIGDGARRGYLENYISENGIKNTNMLGRRPQKEVYEHLQASDLIVFPSIEEGFGIPIVEAYSCGIPAVYFSDIDAAKDIYHEDCTILPKSRSDEDLKNAIVEALEKDWDAEKIREFSKNFSQEKIGKDYNSLLHAPNVKCIDAKVVSRMIRNAAKNSKK